MGSEITTLAGVMKWNWVYALIEIGDERLCNERLHRDRGRHIHRGSVQASHATRFSVRLYQALIASVIRTTCPRLISPYARWKDDHPTEVTI